MNIEARIINKDISQSVLPILLKNVLTFHSRWLEGRVMLFQTFCKFFFTHALAHPERFHYQLNCSLIYTFKASIRCPLSTKYVSSFIWSFVYTSPSSSLFLRSYVCPRSSFVVHSYVRPPLQVVCMYAPPSKFVRWQGWAKWIEPAHCRCYNLRALKFCSKPVYVYTDQ